MRTFLFCLLGLIVGYVLGALLCNYAIVMLVTSNSHDRNLEAQMTSAFVGGPIGALIGAIAGVLLARRR